MTEKKQSLSYKDSGVDIDAATGAKKNIAEMVKNTFTSNVLTGIGGFGGLFEVPSDYQKPVLVSSADGVGTKLKVAFLSGKHDSVGQCLVNHCVNDILCTGAIPLFFLDYIATGALTPGIVESIVSGLAKACAENGCALVGGETAEMPDFYTSGEYDVAGTIVGIVEKDGFLTPDRVEAGDVLIGFDSSGLHTNGYSLVRKIVFDHIGLSHDSYVAELGCTVSEELLKVHRSYLNQILPSIQANEIKTLAHITGGGLTDNLPRSIAGNCDAVIQRNTWEVPAVFKWLESAGNVDSEEMYRVFNMGIGMVAVVDQKNTDAVLQRFASAEASARVIGEINSGSGVVRYV